MKRLSCLLAILMLSISCSVASAFQFRVQDPPTAHPIHFVFVGQSFNVKFGTCTAGETATGCWYGENETSPLQACPNGCSSQQQYNLDATIHTLDISFAHTSGLGSQSVTCDLSGMGSVFTTASVCGDVNGTYVFDLSGGSGIPLFTIFTIEETGAPIMDFGTGTGLGGNTVTPEPESLVLMATGMLLFAFVAFRQNRTLFMQRS